MPELAGLSQPPKADDLRSPTPYDRIIHRVHNLLDVGATGALKRVRLTGGTAKAHNVSLLPAPQDEHADREHRETQKTYSARLSAEERQTENGTKENKSEP